jgi:glycosyltransferase involved in cell wall biosynthesis
MPRKIIHKNEFPNVGFIICISKIGNEKFFLSMVNKIKQYKLENSIYILLGNHLYWPILKKIDLFVRPTLSDNFGISIAEALHFGKKAIASDVCRRPKDTILFKGGDKKDFFEKVYYSLQELSPNNQKINKYDVV